MKFIGKPNEVVIERRFNPFKKVQTRKLIAIFDDKGEFETQDDLIIEKMKSHFKQKRRVKNEIQS